MLFLLMKWRVFETMFPRLKKVNVRMQPMSSRLLKRLLVLGQEKHCSGEVRSGIQCKYDKLCFFFKSMKIQNNKQCSNDST
jgi:hypothetical protein